MLIRFAVARRTLPWQPILWTEFGRLPSTFGTLAFRFPKRFAGSQFWLNRDTAKTATDYSNMQGFKSSGNLDAKGTEVRRRGRRERDAESVKGMGRGYSRPQPIMEFEGALWVFPARSGRRPSRNWILYNLNVRKLSSGTHGTEFSQ